MLFSKVNSDDPLYIFNLAKPINQYDGTLEGVELAVQHLFDNDWGVMANVTMIDGDTDVDPYPAADASEQFALPGFGDAANLAVFYENEKSFCKGCIQRNRRILHWL